MKGTDRAILMGVLAVFVLGAFYFMVLSPKRKDAAKLSDEIAVLQGSISEQEQAATFAEEARRDFPTYYGRVVVLGKAVPEDADSASMLVQLNSISDSAQVDFLGIELSASGGATAPAEATPPPAEGAEPPAEGTAPAGGEATPASTGAATAPAPVPATETAVATLPIGATVGPAGLPALPYDLAFKGRFFSVADFIAGLDGLVRLRESSGQVDADGRLLTIDGFTLKGGAPGSSPELEAKFAVTSYVTPAEQGLTLGATPGGPAPVPGQPQTTPTASVTP